VTVNGTNRSSAELAHDIVHEAHELVRLEVQLAVRELKELLVRNAIAVGLLALGGLLLGMGVLVALPVLLVLLWPNHVLGAAIWLGACVLLGAALLLAGRLALRLEPPRRTLASLQETRQWVLRQIRSNDR
jgi:uncharacterized membrane protein YqjE